MANLRKHYGNIDKFNVPCIIALNRFPSDTDEEIRAVVDAAEREGMNIAPADIFRLGGEGGLELAEKTVRLIAGATGRFRTLYDWEQPVEDKIFTVASEIYGAVSIDYRPLAGATWIIRRFAFDKLPVCTPRPSSPCRTTRASSACRGLHRTVWRSRSPPARFLIPITGEILRMPGLSKTPAAYHMISTTRETSRESFRHSHPPGSAGGPQEADDGEAQRR